MELAIQKQKRGTKLQRGVRADLQDVAAHWRGPNSGQRAEEFIRVETQPRAQLLWHRLPISCWGITSAIITSEFDSGICDTCSKEEPQTLQRKEKSN